jgi:hypothetical protein
LRETWPEAAADLEGWKGKLDETPVGESVTPYLEVTRAAADRMVRGEFQSADAVEAFAALGGMWAKDVWRVFAEGQDPGEAEPDGEGAGDG